MDVTVPDLGDFSDVEVIEILVKPGDVVAAEDSLITLETDKATMDVPSPAAGKVSEIKVEAGSTVSTGDLIVVLEDEGGSGAEDSDSGAGGDAARSPEAAPSDTSAEPSGAAAEPATDTSAEPADAAAEPADAAAEPSGTAAEPDAAADAGATAAAEPELVTVPDLGDFSDVDVIEVLVAVGDEVEAEQGLITLETDKATMDVPAPAAGEVLELMVEAGGTVNPGDAVARIRPARGTGRETGRETGRDPGRDTGRDTAETSGGADGGAPAGKAEAAVSEHGAPAADEPAGHEGGRAPKAGHDTALPAVGMIDETAFSKAHASPSVRKLARELGVDLGRVEGKGRKGRVTSDDLKAFVKKVMTEGTPGSALPKLPEVDFAKFGPVEQVRLTRIQKIAGPRLQASWLNLPHVTQHEDADITGLEEKRQALKEEAASQNLKLTPLAFIMRAVALTLEEFPRFRSSLSPDGSSLIVKDYYHLGFAADTPNGLVVPVIRDADRKDLFELAAALGELSEKARDGKLAADDVQGGVFTVSSLGGIGGTYFTPIINAPEVAILGVSRASLKPVYTGEAFIPRLMLPLSLSYDHRVIDGAEAARFITHLAATLGQVDRLVAAIP